MSTSQGGAWGSGASQEAAGSGQGPKEIPQSVPVLLQEQLLGNLLGPSFQAAPPLAPHARGGAASADPILQTGRLRLAGDRMAPSLGRSSPPALQDGGEATLPNSKFPSGRTGGGHGSQSSLSKGLVDLPLSLWQMGSPLRAGTRQAEGPPLPSNSLVPSFHLQKWGSHEGPVRRQGEKPRDSHHLLGFSSLCRAAASAKSPQRAPGRAHPASPRRPRTPLGHAPCFSS